VDKLGNERHSTATAAAGWPGDQQRRQHTVRVDGGRREVGCWRHGRNVHRDWERHGRQHACGHAVCMVLGDADAGARAGWPCVAAGGSRRTLATAVCGYGGMPCDGGGAVERLHCAVAVGCWQRHVWQRGCQRLRRGSAAGRTVRRRSGYRPQPNLHWRHRPRQRGAVRRRSVSIAWLAWRRRPSGVFDSNCPGGCPRRRYAVCCGSGGRRRVSRGARRHGSPHPAVFYWYLVPYQPGLPCHAGYAGAGRGVSHSHTHFTRGQHGVGHG